MEKREMEPAATSDSNGNEKEIASIKEGSITDYNM
jgi:hypothetical protein